MASIELDRDLFWSRVNRLYSNWLKRRESEGSGWSGVDSWSMVVGKPDEAASNLGETLILYLLGFTFTDTLVVFTKETLYIVASSKKLKLIEQVKNDPKSKGIKLELVEKLKNDPGASMDKAIEALKGSFEGKKFGFPMKDKLSGSFAPSWKSLIDEKLTSENVVDVTMVLNSVIARKDEAEVHLMKKAGGLASKTMKRACALRMEEIIDDDLKVTHLDFSNEIDTKIKARGDLCDSVFPPSVQSGGEYSLKLGLEPTKQPLSSDTILFSIGVRYKDYHACMARTFLVDPSSEQQRIYTMVTKVHQHVISKLRPGAILGEIYKSAKAKIEKEMPFLASCFTSNCGWALGLVFRNRNFVIKASNNEEVMSGMTFCVRTGFDGVELKNKVGPKKMKKFSCVLGDVVLVSKSEAEELTKYTGDVVYRLKDDEDEDEDESSEEEKEDKKDNEVFVVGENKIKRSLRSSRRTAAQIEAEKSSASLEKAIVDQQKKLMKTRAKEALKNDGESTKAEAEEEKQIEIVRKYANTKQYPHGLKRNQVFCDPERECVFLPVFGYHVPFHISVIKSVSKSDEEHYTVLRLNFFYPTGNVGYARDTPKEMRAVLEKYKEMNYVKEMSFRSRDSQNLNHQMRMIKELQKRVKQRQKKEEIEKGLVEQADLILNRTGRKPSLLDVSMRPSIRKGKCVGRLSAHVNGFRFRTTRGEVFDLIYANVKHFFFQPCEKELIVLIHFHLHNPMLVGRVKTRDVQFYAEVVEGSTALDSSSKRGMYDPDEIDEENRERKLRAKLNKAFENFCRQVLQVVENNNMTIGQGNEFDIPYRALGFNGVPHKEMVLLQPTVYCLVNLTETPFFVVSMDEVAHIHFERTDFRVSKTFDMVFIMKKHLLPDCEVVPQRVQSIPVASFDTIKGWIHEKGDVTFTKGTTPLNWKMVMIGVREELQEGIFWKNLDGDGEPKPVGWLFLSMEDEEDVEEQDDDEGSQYSGPSEDSGESEDFSEDDLSDESEEFEPSDESGEDWDELHAKAARSDRERVRKDAERDARDASKAPKSKRRRKGRR